MKKKNIENNIQPTQPPRPTKQTTTTKTKKKEKEKEKVKEKESHNAELVINLNGVCVMDVLREVFLFTRNGHAQDIISYTQSVAPDNGEEGEGGGVSCSLNDTLLLQPVSTSSMTIKNHCDDASSGFGGGGGDDNKKNDTELLLFDIKKRCMKYFANMGSFSNSLAPLPVITTIPCWNCRRTFTTPPLGIPIRFIKHHSQSLDATLLKKYFEDNNYPSGCATSGYFETEGVVCRWECMKNFILENISNTRYKDSVGLMYLMHTFIEGKPLECKRAGSWRCLKTWGGHLTDEDYDKATSTTTFVDTVNVRKPLMFSISRYYEQLA